MQGRNDDDRISEFKLFSLPLCRFGLGSIIFSSGGEIDKLATYSCKWSLHIPWFLLLYYNIYRPMKPALKLMQQTAFNSAVQFKFLLFSLSKEKCSTTMVILWSVIEYYKYIYSSTGQFWCTSTRVFPFLLLYTSTPLELLAKYFSFYSFHSFLTTQKNNWRIDFKQKLISVLHNKAWVVCSTQYLSTCLIFIFIFFPLFNSICPRRAI